MTREEAIEKIKDLYHSAIYHQNTVSFLDCLEALGLIKFDDNKKISLKDAILHAKMYGITQDEFIYHLKKNGYKIVPIDDVDNYE